MSCMAEEHGIDMTTDGFCRECGEQRVDDEIRFVTSTGDPVWFIAVYAVDRCYGGPEEGGWWYDSGELAVHVEVALTEREAKARRDELRNKEGFPTTGKRYSVLGGDDWDVYLFEGTIPPLHFPEQVPHYE